MAIIWQTPTSDQHATIGEVDTRQPNDIQKIAYAFMERTLQEAPQVDDWEIIVINLGDNPGGLSSFAAHLVTDCEPHYEAAWICWLPLPEYARRFDVISAAEDSVGSRQPYEALPSEAAHDAIVAELAEAVTIATLDLLTQESIQALAKRPGFGVFTVHEHTAWYREVLTHIAGNPLPPPPKPTNAQELFTPIFNSIVTWHEPIDSTTQSVTFYGRDYDDLSISFIPDQPPSIELCPGLKIIELHETRISPAGVRRLKELFPQCEIIRT